jgi:hypothetical protein
MVQMAWMPWRWLNASQIRAPLAQRRATADQMPGTEAWRFSCRECFAVVTLIGPNAGNSKANRRRLCA